MTGTPRRVYQHAVTSGEEMRLDHPCTQKEMFDKIDKKLDTIVSKLEDGNVKFATIHLRLKILEWIVYGAVGLGLVAIVGLILKSAGMKA